MPRWLKTGLVWVAAVTAACLAFGWFVLFAPLFSDFRRSVAQDVLSRQIGQPLIIETDVRAFVGGTVHVTVSDVLIPSEEIEDKDLAKLRLLEFDIDSFALLGGQLALDNIRIDGLSVSLLRQEDGATSWSAPADAPSTKSVETDGGSGILAFLSDKTAHVTSGSMNFEDRVSGFEYLFALEALALDQAANDDALSVASNGTLNGQPFEIEGFYPDGAPFSTSAAMGDATVEFNGQAISEERGGGFAGDLILDTGDIGDLLEILKLTRTVEGTGKLTARLTRQGARLSVEDLQSAVEFEDGSVIKLEGAADDLIESLDFDLTASGRLFPEGRPPGKARELSQLELTSFKANLVSEAGSIEFREVLLETNLFESDFREIGPISVGRVRRTESGGLALDNVLAQTGPRDAPYFTAAGGVQDLLQLRDLHFNGTLNGPASLVLDGFQNDTVQAFGGVVAEFEISDSSGQLSLSKLEARSENTDLWTMRASAEARSFTSVDDLDFEVDLDIPDGAAFLAALQLEPVDIGAVEALAAVEGQDNGVETRLSLAAGQSRIETALTTSVGQEGEPIVRGTIRSPGLNMRDLSNIAKSAARFGSLDSANRRGGSLKRGRSAEREIQPLVIEVEESVSEPDQPPRTDGGRVLQPLVLDEPEIPQDSVGTAIDERGRTIQPLVLEFRPSDGEVTDLFDPETIGRDLDLEIGVEIERIVGQAGISRISSELISKDGKADLGPLEFSYGGGYFKVGAAIDFIDSPQLVRVSGATSGWDFGEILREVGAGIDARGKLSAQFDLTGAHESPRSFMNTMSGSVTISMVDGAIASSLLELAGLGLFPWLFSEELRQGYTTIVCVAAPLSIGAGKAASNAMVVETRRVQLVAAGSVDWAQDRISLRAEPRPVGRPLGRSAWPFEVTGRLSNPDFRIRRGSILESIFSAPGANEAVQQRTPCKPDALQAR